MFIDVLGFMEPLAILVASVVIYIFYFQSKYKKETGFYKNPDWNFVFKRWYAEKQLNAIKLIKKEKLVENLNKNLSERPLVLKNENSSDMVLFYGTDQIGNSIILRMTRLRHRTADLWIMIRLNNDNNDNIKYYTFPEHPNTRVYEVTTGKFKASGLEFECLEPFIRWRITYSGYLREKIRNEIKNSSIDNKDELNDYTVENELKFIKFNFFFTGSNKPLFWPLDWNSKLMATGLATENWKDGSWPNVLNIPGNGGYDQFGRLYGQIFLPDNKVKELNLPGLRQRRWEAFQNFNVRRLVSVFGVCNNGCIFNIGAVSYHKALSHVQFGNVRLPNDEIYTIDWTDFKIPNIAEDMKTIPHQTVINFTAGGKSFKAFLYMEHDKIIKLIKGSPYTWRIVNIPTKFDLNTTSGHGILTAWFPYKPLPNERKLKEPYRFKKLVFNGSLPDRNKFVLSFNEIESQSKVVAGGKGASLALLTAACYDLNYFTPFEIPKGFIVSSSALRQFLITNSEIYLELKNLEDICAGKLNDSLEECCKRIKNLFKETTLDRDIIIEILASIEVMSTSETSNNLCYAIRSSGIDEDGQDFSGAGQNETILGVREPEKILEAIKTCWASLYSHRSVEYRRAHSQSIINDMAVVVQTMIPSECSGVLFTKHTIPSADCSSDILITANYGLGETVVSGAVEPDTFFISKNYDSTKFQIKQTIIGEKAYSLNLKESGGIEKVENKTKNVSCLSDEFILKLSKIGVNLEKMYGNPQDIEWAIYKDTIYLLQSRPITTLNKFSDWEYLHEFDSPMMSTNQLLTRGNVGEVFVGPIDHLTTSTVIKILNMALETNKKELLENLTISKGIVMVSQQAFIDLLSFYKDLKPGNVTVQEKVQVFGLLGSLELTPEIKMACYNRNGPFTWSSLLEIMQAFLSLFRPGRRLTKLENSVNHFRLINLKNKITSFETSKELLLEIKILIEKNLLEVTEHHMKLSMANSILQSICLNVLLEGGDNFTPEHMMDLTKIMSASEGVISAEIPKKINEIANTIYLQSNSKEFCELNISDVPLWLEENSPVAFRQFNQFFRTFGYRCLNEFCLSSTPWENNKEYIIKIIQDSLKGNNLGQEHVHHETQVEFMIQDLVTPKKSSTKWFLQFLVPYCRRSVQRREQSKDFFIYFINVLRKYFNRLSELMQIEGILPQKNLIYFLTYHELQQILYRGEISLIQKAIHRQKLSNNWSKIKFEDVIFGMLPQAINTSKEIPIKFDSASKIIGLSAQNGVVEGRACVLTDISEINQIQSGDILITYATDIGWSPVFPILGGLVTELGGLISHGAVVAREYGLPCIIGAKNATNCFKTGDKIYLDANSGFVRKL